MKEGEKQTKHFNITKGKIEERFYQTPEVKCDYLKVPRLSRTRHSTLNRVSEQWERCACKASLYRRFDSTGDLVSTKYTASCCQR